MQRSQAMERNNKQNTQTLTFSRDDTILPPQFGMNKRGFLIDNVLDFPDNHEKIVK